MNNKIMNNNPANVATVSLAGSKNSNGDPKKKATIKNAKPQNIRINFFFTELYTLKS